jgi:hypothetical protein
MHLMKPEILSQSMGVTTLAHAMPDDRLVIETRQDVGPILDYCQRQRNDAVRSVLGRETREIAAIPINALEEIRQKYGLDWYDKSHRPAIMAHIKFGDYRKFLTTDAKLKRGV